jgi:hypothetical protein
MGPDNSNLLKDEKIINDESSLNHYQYSSEEYYKNKLARSIPSVLDVIKKNYEYLCKNATYKDMRLPNLVKYGY